MTKPKRKKYVVPKLGLTMPAQALQSFLWTDKKYPDLFSLYMNSPALMKIYKILVDMPRTWHDHMEYDLAPDAKLNLVFGADYRTIYEYECIEPFVMNLGVLKNPHEVADAEMIKAARQIQPGNTILVRYDTRDEDMKLDLQILTRGIFQDSSEDWKMFIIDTVDFKHIRRYLKLKDSGGVNEIFAPPTGDRHRDKKHN